MKKIKIECTSCKGTGVYIGVCERDGASVICGTCKGTGGCFYKYKEFTGLKKRKDVKRVYKSTYGFVIAPKKITFFNDLEIDMFKKGISYADFLLGKLPKHIKSLACPMMVDQGACHKIKGFTDMCPLGILLLDCEHQLKRADCWKRFND